ncbi:uncharacterized protein F5147DRAFT_842141 [Suillus discolor]|uniref:BTB domain-containing protein n=1 Tax=Suillus discolor TaxID=1912936 RepID=A0A9P7ER80_9AGAM|nr:uncharacterized protein F5147DRAFT_842141 [Suillus discolor]KAG2083127.1 hypothetical protein F5147DRAFT_842141 [Suillus discolor]
MKLLMATPPFLHAKADIIFRSSDGVDFHVITLFLNLASSSFDSIIEQAVQSNQVEGDLPVVPVEENHRVLDIWLRFCYPSTLAEDPPLHEIEDIIPVLEAARKYSLQTLEHKVRRALKSRMEKEPLTCFAIAMRAHLNVEATLAAEYTLRQSLIPASVPEIDLITAKELLALLTYHQRCGVSVQSLGVDLSWITSSYMSLNAAGYQWIVQSGSCNCESDSRFLLNGQRPLKWWSDYMEKSLVSLCDKPSGHTVLAGVGDTVRGVRAIGCSQCCSNILVNMTGFAEFFSTMVDILTAEVDLDMDLLKPFVPARVALSAKAQIFMGTGGLDVEPSVAGPAPVIPGPSISKLLRLYKLAYKLPYSSE